MTKTELTLSEFEALDNINMHYLNNVPCPSTVKDSLGIWIKKGSKIPKIFVKTLILNRPEQISVTRKDFVIQLTKEQQIEYGLDLVKIAEKKKAKEPKTEKEVVDKQFPQWTMENLNIKLGELKSKGFKEWAEKEFGSDNVDKRRSSDNIIVNILKLQDEGKL